MVICTAVCPNCAVASAPAPSAAAVPEFTQTPDIMAAAENPSDTAEVAPAVHSMAVWSE